MRPGNSLARLAFRLPEPLPARLKLMIGTENTVAFGAGMRLLAVEIKPTMAAFRSSMDVRHAQR